MSYELQNGSRHSDTTSESDDTQLQQIQSPAGQFVELKIVVPDELEEEVTRTTRTEKATNGGRTTTTTTTTTHKTRDGARVLTKQTRQITKVGGLGSTNYRMNTEQADDIAERLANVFQSQALPGTAGLISVRTESWNSTSGQKIRSCKMQPWGVPDTSSDAHPHQHHLQQQQQQPSGDIPVARLQPTVDVNSQSSQPLSNDASIPPPQQQRQQQPQQLLRVSAAGPGVQRSVSSIKQMLLDWCKATVEGYPNVKVTNFSSSWNDGLAFCALIHHFYPDAFDFSELSPVNRRYNFQLAFDTADKYAKIAPLLDVEDMVQMTSPDWKCVFTYLQSFYRRFAVAQRQQRPQQQQEQELQPSSSSSLAPVSTSDVGRPSQLLV